MSREYPKLERKPVNVILSIDAAWTTHEPSGVAVVIFSRDKWRCAGVAPSYSAFLSLAAGNFVEWGARHFDGSTPKAALLLEAAGSLAGASVDLVTIDMPVATVPIISRRTADVSISREFGKRGCATHTPSATRPGPLGASISQQFMEAGYTIATTSDSAGTSMRLLEVYPHPALLTLLQRRYRVPYKVRKARRYWPGFTVERRISALLDEFRAIYKALTPIVDHIGIVLPRPDTIPTLAALKRYEDALDAIICAWVGIRYAEGVAIAFGDATAAIWCPTDPSQSVSHNCHYYTG
jgi:predicted RNase H-like nuclease